MNEQIQSSNVSKGGWRESVALAEKRNAEERAKRPLHLRFSPGEAMKRWNETAERRRKLGLR